jgi:polysaccharide deacetylase 2 family uncharacterized protein YibQ
MADDLSAPLGRKLAKPARGFRLSLSPDRIPLARIAFGVVALIVIGVGARILLVNDPLGGRPVAEIGVNSTRNTNSIAANVAAPGPATITAGPEVPANGVSMSMVGADVPEGAPDAPAPTAADAANADGLFPDLLEESEHGAIPRVSATGQSPFEAYAQPSEALTASGHKPLIAIVVTGLGLNETSTNSAIQMLPNTVSLAFAPYGKALKQAAGSARAAGHEILLEAPLEPFDYPESDPGPDTLLTGQAPRDNLNKLFTVMGKFGGYVGLINHMGARFTASTADFNPVMEELGARGLGYLDDGSSNRSVAPQLAAANSVPFGRADMALDRNPSRGPIMDQLKALEAKATDKGSAIGVISALPVSVQTLAEWSKTAEDRGFTLVPISALMQKSS